MRSFGQNGASGWAQSVASSPGGVIDPGSTAAARGSCRACQPSPGRAARAGRPARRRRPGPAARPPAPRRRALLRSRRVQIRVAGRGGLAYRRRNPQFWCRARTARSPSCSHSPRPRLPSAGAPRPRASAERDRATPLNRVGAPELARAVGRRHCAGDHTDHRHQHHLRARGSGRRCSDRVPAVRRAAAGTPPGPRHLRTPS